MIYAYWEGNPHWYYELCWRTIKRHNPRAVRLGPDDVARVIGPLPNAVREAYVVHRVDWIRKQFIHAVGGLWVDMDFICWSDLEPLAALDFDFVGWKEWHSKEWMDNFFVARAGSELIKEAADYALNQMETYGTGVGWLSTNAHAISHAFNIHRWKKCMEIPTHLIGPVSVMHKEWFQASTQNINVCDFTSLGFMTSFHGIGEWCDRIGGADQLLGSDTVLGALLRRGLEC